MTGSVDQIGLFLTRWTAAEGRGDTAALDGYLTDDFVGVGPLGFMLSKQDWLSRHATGDLTYEAFRLEEVQVRAYGAVAVVTARQTGQGAYRGQPVPSDLRATAVLVEQAGSWRLAGLHLSFIAGTPGAPPLPGRP
jgi:ketosteroid isomerase-like protein